MTWKGIGSNSFQKFNSVVIKILQKFNQLVKYAKNSRNIDSPSVDCGLQYFSTQES